MDIGEILALTSKLGDEHKDLKTQIETKIKELNGERGKALSDLNGFKEQLSTIKNEKDNLEKQNMTFAQLSKALADSGFKDGDITKMAEKLQVQKSQEDELAEMKRILDEQTKKIKEYEKINSERQLKDALVPKLKEAMAEFKDKDGNKVPLVDDFVPYDDLLKPIDVENETLLQDRLTKVLEKAYTKQIDFQKRNNMVISGSEVHDVPSGDGHYRTDGALNVEKIVKTVTDGKGSLDSASAAIAALRQTEKK